MATLTSTKIKNTYDALLKASDNDAIGSSAKQITDGLGNGTPLYISTTQIGIGVTPEATYDLHVYQNAKVGGNLTITGDLTVNGTTTTVDTDTLRVEDPLIEVARNNTSSDAVDIGIYGKYAPSGTTLYAGLFRDTGDDKFKLFKSLEEQPTTTVNTSGTGYAVATLVANFEGTLTGVIASTTTATTQSTGDNSTKVATTAYVDTTAGNYLPLAGGTMSGNIAMGSNNISGAGTIIADSYIQTNSNFLTKGTLKFRNNADSSWLNGFRRVSGADTLELINISDINTNGGSAVTIGNDLIVDNELTVSGTGQSSFAGQVTIPATPSASTDAASKGYVDSQVGANNELSEVLANGNTTGGTDIEVNGDNIIFGDSATIGTDDTLIFGASNDLRIAHNGTDSVIRNYTGGLYIDSDGADRNIHIRNDDGSGSKTDYMVFNGAVGFTINYKLQNFQDNVSATFGNSSDLQIYHDGSNSYINENGTGVLAIQTNGAEIQLNSTGGEYLARFIPDAGVKLYYDNSLKLETTSGGISVTGDADISSTVLVGGADSIFAENNIRFKSSGGAFIDHNTTGQSISFRTSVSSSLDTTALTIASNANATFAGKIESVKELINVNSANGTRSGGFEVQDDGDLFIGTATTAGNIVLETGNTTNGLPSTGTARLTVNSTGATFAGTISSGDITIEDTNPNLTLSDTSTTNLIHEIKSSSDNLRISADTNNVDAGTKIEFYTDGVERLEIEDDGQVNIISAGTVTNPCLTIGDDVNTGIWRPASDTFAISTGGNERMRIDSGGDVLMGNTVVNPASGFASQRGFGYDNSTGNVQIAATSGNALTVGRNESSDGAIMTLRKESNVIHSFGSTTSYLLTDVGIGTTSPRNDANFVTLQVGSTATAASQIVLDDNDTNGPWRIISNQSLIINDDATERMRIDSSGNLSLATATSLDFNVADFAQIKFKESGAITIDSDNNQSSRNFQFKDGDGSSLMFIGDDGNVGIGTTSPSTPLQVHGQQKWYTTNADGNELRGFFNPGGSGDGAELYLYRDDGATQGVALRGQGNSYFRVDSTSDKLINFYYGTSNVGQIVTGGTNVLYQSNSDYRLKENVVEMTGALDRVEQLKPSTYNFISQPETQVDGFMAHELQEVVPQAVSGEKDEMNEDGTPKYQGVDHSQIIPLLVGAIQELKAEIETLKAQIN